MDERYHLYSSSRNFYYNEDQPGTHYEGFGNSNSGQSRQTSNIHESGSQKERLQTSGSGWGQDSRCI